MSDPLGLSRRVFLERAGLTGAAAVLMQLPAALGPRGLLAEAEAVELDVVRDTFNGFIAFSLPGDDEYSVAQGESFPGPGGLASGGVSEMIATLDLLLPASMLGPAGVAVPLSAALATLLNSFALQVNSAAEGGPFLSPFARLSFREKAEVFRRLEAEALLTAVIEPVRYVAGILPSLSAFVAFSEAGGYDKRSRTVTRRPAGWEICRYTGPADGHRGFKGYYRGRTAAGRIPRRRRRVTRRRRRRGRAL